MNAASRPIRSPSTVGLLFALSLAALGCGESLTAVNENPNEPTDVPAATILPNAAAGLGNTLWSSFWHMSLFATWSQHYSQIQYPDEDRYNVRQSVLQGYWDRFYDVAKDFHTIAGKGEATGQPNVEAVGLIMKAFTFQLIADAWGPAPYSEALSLEQGNATPAYDSGREIYEALLADLESAQGMITAGSDPFGSNDLVYGGDMEKWRRFANSLRLRLAMRMSSVDPTAAAPIVADAVAAGTFASNADNAVLSYLETDPNRHPIFENGLTRDDHAPSETMLAIMRSLDDPRIPIYARAAPNSSPADPLEVRYAGAFPGRSSQPHASLNDIARIGAFWRDDPSAPAVFLSYAEVAFFQAEAALRGFIGGSAQEFYEAGVRAALEQYGVDGAAVDAYLAQAGVAWGTGGLQQMEQIGVQKWLALYNGNALEAYAEIRRLGYPAIQPGPNAMSVNGGHPPTRIQYPPLEESLNGQAYQEALTILGGANTMSGVLFWDPDPMVP